jgi:putative endonuclease
VQQPCVYILASQPNGTLYVGVTNDLFRRVSEHRTDLIGGFTARYQVHQLVYFEVHVGMREAITRERQIKEWRRRWKLELIERTNPRWRDLYHEILGGSDHPGESRDPGLPRDRQG